MYLRREITIYWSTTGTFSQKFQLLREAVTEWTRLTFPLQQWAYYWSCLQNSREVERFRDENLTPHADIHWWPYSNSRFSMRADIQNRSASRCDQWELYILHISQVLNSGHQCSKVTKKYWLNVNMMLASTEKPVEQGNWFSKTHLCEGNWEATFLSNFKCRGQFQLILFNNYLH